MEAEIGECIGPRLICYKGEEAEENHDFTRPEGTWHRSGNRDVDQLYDD